MAAKTQKRISRATKVAYWAEIQRIFFAVHLTAFIHSWATVVLSILVPSALTVLQFLAALHRSSKNGYLGCAAAYSLLAPQISRSTGRKCSVRTLERGLAFLKRIGLVELTWYAIPDQIVHNGEHSHKINGTEKVFTKNGWKSTQIRIITLTERAIAMWDRRTRGKGSVYIPHFRHFLTSAKLAGSLQIDLIDKSIKLESESSKHRSSSSIRNRRFDNVPSTDNCREERPRAMECGQTTSPVGRSDKRTDGHTGVEHQSSTVGLPKQNTAPRKSIPKRQRGITSVSDNIQQFVSQALVDNEKPKSEPEIPPNTLTGSAPKSKRDGRVYGVSSVPPKIPKSSKNKTSWGVATAYILSELHRALRKFSRREAEAIYARAKIELSRAYPSGWPTTIDWAYWVGRFGLMTIPQRRYHIHRDILPPLRNSSAVIPREPKRFSQHRNVDVLSEDFDGYLKRLFNKFCVD